VTGGGSDNNDAPLLLSSISKGQIIPVAICALRSDDLPSRFPAKEMPAPWFAYDAGRVPDLGHSHEHDSVRQQPRQ
jgi:hypothetical protein